MIGSASFSLKVLLCLSVAVVLVGIGLCQTKDETDPNYWRNQAEEELQRAEARINEINNNKAKNVIIYVGDGMGVATLTSGRIFKGQSRQQDGESFKLAIDDFPNLGFSKIYSVDKQVPDSAATATALFTGVKTNEGIIGLNAKAKVDDCNSSKGNEVQSILIDAYNAGMSTGIVTTTTVIHGTPAAAFAHTPQREWYSDANVPKDAADQGCKDIALQLLELSDKITVILGGGRKHFKPSTTNDPDNGVPNDRQDGRDLVREWQGMGQNENRVYVSNKTQLMDIDVENTDRVLGLFNHDHIKFEVEREPSDITIVDMTKKAIEILQKNPKGYLLIVEGGRIDHGHHVNAAGWSLIEMAAFDDAIEAGEAMVSDRDTLRIVTADHGHTLTHGGDMDRGSFILGKAPDPAMDGLPYTGLLYGNGPGYKESIPDIRQLLNPFRKLSPGRQDITDINTAGMYIFQSAAPLLLSTHSGSDVPIFAKGPKAHLFHTTHEQTYVAHVVRYAAGIGPGKPKRKSSLPGPSESTAQKQLANLKKFCQRLFP